MKEFKRSRLLNEESQRYLPGGVDSPVRAYKAVGGNPPFIERGDGAYIYDVDGNRYIDYVGSWGPLILGHAHPQVIKAIQKAAEKGTSFGAPTELELILAKMVNEAMPSIEMVRFVNSGTEADMSALRVARAFTKRDRIIKFEGCYHGHSDGLLAKSGSGLATLGIPDSAGVPASYTQNTFTVPYNNIQAVKGLFQLFSEQIAAVIVEPVAANMGVVPPSADFLQKLREVTADHGALLVFDEVITGFRVGYGGAQALYGVKADLTCLGKIIGGGLPVGAYGGREEIMRLMAPLGPVYQAGTLSGNPLAMTAGIETLKILRQPGTYEQLEERSKKLAEGIVKGAHKAGVKVQLGRVGSLMTPFFAGSPVTDYESAKKSDTTVFNRFFHGILEDGLYWPPSQFEAAFVSLAHSEADIEQTVEKVGRVFEAIGKG
jgi:glutamate-1-semialdehyde 2,1-aminomutase